MTKFPRLQTTQLSMSVFPKSFISSVADSIGITLGVNDQVQSMLIEDAGKEHFESIPNTLNHTLFNHKLNHESHTIQP